jgi:hypothetical protein
MMRRGAIGGGVACFFLLWLVMWTVGTVSMDVAATKTVVRQTAALDYPHVTGTVVRNDRIPKITPKGNRYHEVKFAYAYEVGGRRYESDHLRFDGRKADEQFADANSVGSTLSVFYNPRDPADAGLQTGLSGSDLALPLILIVFNGVALFGCWAAVRLALSPFKWLAAPRGLRIQSRRGMLVPRADNVMTRSGFGLIFTLLTGVAAAIVVAGLYAGRGAGIIFPLVMWALILTWLVRRTCRMRPWSRRDNELKLDPTARKLLLPVQPGLPGMRNVIEFDRVLTVELVAAPAAARKAQTPPPAKTPVVQFAAVMVKYWQTGRDPRSALIGIYPDADTARAVQRWLVEQMGLDESAAIDRLATVEPATPERGKAPG